MWCIHKHWSKFKIKKNYWQLITHLETQGTCFSLRNKRLWQWRSWIYLLSVIRAHLSFLLLTWADRLKWAFLGENVNVIGFLYILSSGNVNEEMIPLQNWCFFFFFRKSLSLIIEIKIFLNLQKVFWMNTCYYFRIGYLQRQSRISQKLIL